MWPRQRKIIRFVGEHSDSLRAAYGGCSLDAHCGGCVRPYGITSQMAIYRYKRLCRLISLSNTTCSFLRIGRVPAVIGYCRPWSHYYMRACPSGGGFALLRQSHAG